MMLVRGTKKLLTDLELTPAQRIGDGEPKRALHEWYGNLIRIDRRKCIVFTDAVTLFTFFIPGVTKKQYGSLRGLFFGCLRSALIAQGLALPAVVARDELVFGPTRDRRVIGSQNDLIFQITYHVAASGGLAAADVADVHRRVNETPMSLIDDSPDRAIRRWLAG